MSEYINNIIYGVKSFITGMGLTLKHLRNKKDLVATLQYPNEKWPLPERNIGFEPKDYNVIRSRLHVDIDDCIGCLQCEKACPVDCIKIDTIKPPKGNDYDCGKTSHDTQKKMIVPRFTIDMSECMYCDLCVHPCPEECIYMVGGPNEPKHEIDYEFSQYERHGLVFEFATSTEQDIIDIGGAAYLEERKAKEEKRKNGESLKGIVESESSDDVSVTDTEAAVSKHKDPLLEIYNSVPDKVARGIAKKATVFGKRSKLDFASMAKEVESRISKAGKISDEMTKAIEILKNYVEEKEILSASEEFISSSVPIDKPKVEEILKKSDFNVKSLDFIEDKMVRGSAKKSFMAAKRKKIDINMTIDLIISDLEATQKMNQDLKDQLLSFKSATTSTSQSDPAVVKEISINKKEEGLFDIKLLNDLEDKMVRGSAKKIYMGGKRANKSSQDVVKDIIEQLSDKLDDQSKTLIEGLI